MGRLSAGEAAEVWALSLRQVRRQLTVYTNDGAVAPKHGNAGKKPDDALDNELKRRPPRHRNCRERYSREEILIQIGGSRDDWLEWRCPDLGPLGAIDNATGKIPYASLRE